MFGRIKWDTYAIIMVAFVPFLLLTAWGLTEWDERSLHSKQCALATTWLEESEEIVPLFTSASTMGRISPWIASFEELDSPRSAAQLRSGILQSANHSSTYYPALTTGIPGVLNPPDGLFERRLLQGAEDLIQHCPEVAPLLPEAFPMIFTEEPTNE